MDKFSVIIPTMWKSEYTIELLERYSQSKYVGEIILINNNKAETPQISKIDKLKVITPNENIYVNPAWNLGIELSQNKNITISNDDILFDIDEYYYYLEQTKEMLEFGFIGSHSDNYTLTESKGVNIEIYDNKTNVGGWGCLFSFSKELWKPIPEVLKIWYGDNWIHGTNELILQLRGLAIQTRMSTTSDLDEVRDVRDNDTIQWGRLLNGLH